MSNLREILEENKALYHQEELLLEATELLASVMEDQHLSKAELARRIGKSKAFVTQCLSGHQNLTLRTLSDLFLALGYRLQLGAVPSAQTVYRKMIRLYPVGGWALERSDRSNCQPAADSWTAVGIPSLCEAA